MVPQVSNLNNVQITLPPKEFIVASYCNYQLISQIFLLKMFLRHQFSSAIIAPVYRQTIFQVEWLWPLHLWMLNCEHPYIAKVQPWCDLRVWGASKRSRRQSDDILNLNTVSELYMVSDKSPDFEETWSFLDRRMSDIGLLISAKTTVSECFSLKKTQ